MTAETQFKDDTYRKYSTRIQKACGGCELAAMIFSHVKYWATRNANRGHNEHDGSFWTYDTLGFLAEKFGKTVRQIRYAISKLKKAGLIETRRAYGWIKQESKLVNWYTIPGLFDDPEDHPEDQPEKTPENPDTTGAGLSVRSDKIVTSINTLPHTEKHTNNQAKPVDSLLLVAEAEELLTERHGEIPEEDRQWIRTKVADLLERLPKAHRPTLLTIIQSDFSVRLKTLLRAAKFAKVREELAEAKLARIRKAAQEQISKPVKTEYTTEEMTDRSWAGKYDFKIDEYLNDIDSSTSSELAW